MKTTPERSIDEIVEEMPVNQCHYCSGDGFTVEHDPYDPTGQTPMQVQCDYCHAEGKITTLDCVRELLQAERQKREEEKEKLAHKIKDAKCWTNPNRGVLLSNPPQHRCDACGTLWYCHEPAPVCTYVMKSDFTNLQALTQPNNK